ncbi:D-alanyl-D-alanine carboxypeptidase [Reyranella sp.]|uniref:D-alanyl-D-alanine carboxypeptidase n=1 Tax=Reyranella sp. TaxID=1929291 RepID=UPI0025D78AB2|nr:D-alanyl-D-alanine carboxypeptidase [Reyranella sp.]
MTPSLRRFVAGLHGLAICTLVATLLVQGSVQAQPNSAKARPTPSGKGHALSKAVRTPSPWVPNPNVNAKDAYLIVDAASGRELGSDQPDELRHPASLTKLMTLYLTFSALDSGKLSLGDALPVSMSALNAPPTKMGMQPNGTVLVRDAVMGLVTRSANDAAVLLAETLGGSEEAFAAQMTNKARQLGMSSTVYRNASGLPNPEQVTTARDMARLANALLRDFPHYYPVFSVLSYNYRGRSLENHNRMLASYAGADGLKTGYTNASGFNLVMSAVRDNRRLIGVVMGGNTAFQRDRLMADLMDQGFQAAQAQSIQPWTSARVPASARYTAANFVPGIGPLDGRSLAGFTKSEPSAVVHASTAPATIAGSWVIQVGSFSDSRAAQAALERATGALPEATRGHGAVTIDEVQLPDKTLHRARLTNLSQQEAVDGCKKLSARKIHCSALQITAR